jgi:hypothetical protein
MSATDSEPNPERDPEAELLKSITSSTGNAKGKRGRRKLLYMIILVLVLILGLELARDGFHPFPVIPPTPAYP